MGKIKTKSNFNREEYTKKRMLDKLESGYKQLEIYAKEIRNMGKHFGFDLTPLDEGMDDIQRAFQKTGKAISEAKEPKKPLRPPKKSEGGESND